MTLRLTLAQLQAFSDIAALLLHVEPGDLLIFDEVSDGTVNMRQVETHLHGTGINAVAIKAQEVAEVRLDANGRQVPNPPRYPTARP